MTLHKEGDYLHRKGGHFHICPMCDDEFFGRKNKKFCSIPCKTKFNNDQASDRKKIFSDYNKLVERCRNILKDFHEQSHDGEYGIPVKSFQLRRFDFTCPVRQIKRKKDGTQFNLIIDYAYRVIPEENEVVIWKPIMK